MFVATTSRPRQRKPPSRGPTDRQISFHGDGEALFGIYITNLLYTVLTLGIYYCWGKIRVRKYLYSQTGLEGDRFAYHGTGKELFIGWLKAALCIGLLFGAMTAIQLGWEGGVEFVDSILYPLAFVILIPVAIVGSRRYRLSRTSWREIRFSFRGHAKELIGIFFRGSFFTGLTFGIYYPWFQNSVREFLVQNSHFGNTPFDYNGRGSDLFRIYLMGLVLTVLTLGLYWFWFAAERQRYYWAHTSFGTARFRSTMTGRRLLNLKVGHWLLLILTLGLAYPWVWVRETRFVIDNLVMEGPLDLASIQQEALAASATGEGMAEFLEVGFLDVDLGL